MLEGHALEEVVEEAGVSSSEKDEMDVVQSLLASLSTSLTSPSRSGVFRRSSEVTSMTELPWMASKTAGTAVEKNQ